MKTKNIALGIFISLFLLLTVASAFAANPVIEEIDTITVIEGTEATFQVKASDADNHGLTFSLRDLGGFSSISINRNTGLITILPGEGQISIDDIKVQVDDSNGNIAEELFNVKVTPVLDIVNLRVNNVNYGSGDETASFRPGDQIRFDVAIKNRFTNEHHEIIGANVRAQLENVRLIVNGDELDDFSFEMGNPPQAIFLNPDEQKILSFTYTVPLDAAEMVEEISFLLIGQDRDVPLQHNFGTEATLNLKIERTPHEIQITDMELSDNAGACNQDTVLSVTIFNTGAVAEDVVVKVTGQEDQLETLPVNEEITVEFILNLEDAVGEQTFVATVVDASVLEIYDTDSVSLAADDCNPVFRFGQVSPSGNVIMTKNENVPFSVTVINGAANTYKWLVDGVNQNDNNGQFTLEGEDLTLGNHIVKVVVNEGLELGLTKTWDVDVTSGLSISAILFENVNRGQVVTKIVTITNTANAGVLENLESSLVNVADKYRAEIVGSLPAALAAGDDATVQLRLTIPDNEADGEHSIGAFQVTNGEGAVLKSQEIKVNVQSFLTLKTFELNGDNDGKLILGDVNVFDIEVENKYSKDMTDVTVTIAILDVDGNDLDKVSDEFDLDANNKDDVALEIDLDGRDIDEDSYTVEIIIEGKADDETTHRTVVTKTIGVDIKKHNVIVDRAVLSSDSLQCSIQQTTDLIVDIKNVGSSNEDDVRIRVFNTDLGIDLERTNLELNKFSDPDDEDRLSFNLLVEGDVKAGNYPIKIEVYLDGDLEDSETVTLTVAGCSNDKEASKLNLNTDKVVQDLQEQLSKKVQEDKSLITSNSFRDSDAYITILGVLTLLIFIAVVLALVVMVITRKR